VQPEKEIAELMIQEDLDEVERTKVLLRKKNPD
jgi:hypothetical protein